MIASRQRLLTPRRIRRICVLLVALGAACSPRFGRAQTSSWRFEHLSIDQGLSQNTVYAAMQDRRGFLWFGTADGLNRYDGYRFETFRRSPADPNSLSHNRIRALREDRDGMLWIGTRNGGLNRYDRETKTFTRFQHDPAVPGSLAHDLVWAIYEDRGGTLWIGTGGGGLDRFDRATASFTHLRHDPADPGSLSHDFIKVLHEDRAGTLWIGTSEGLNRLDPARRTLRRFLLEPEEGERADYNDVTAIHEDRGGRFWLGTRGGLVRFDPELSPASTYYRHDPTKPNDPEIDTVWDIYEARDGMLWLATLGGGLLFFDPSEAAFSRYRHQPADPTGLSGDRVTVLFEDRSGTFWIGTLGAGLNKLARPGRAIAHWRRDPSSSQTLSDDMVMALHEDRSGTVWIGTWNGGLNRLDRRSGVITHYRADRNDPRALARDDVRSVLEHSDGTLWVGTEGGGLHRLDRATGTFTRYPHDPADPRTLRDDDAWVLVEDKSATLWVGTYGGGLSRYHPETDGFTHYLHDEDDANTLSHDVVRAVYEDSRGLLWIGTGGGGLDRFDPESSRFTHFRHDPRDATSLSSDEVLSILEDREGILWVGTHGGGLNRLAAADGTDPSFRSFTEVDGLPNNVVYGLLEDDRGFLWMSTNHGLARFDPMTDSFRTYGVADGLQSNEFNSGAFFRNRDGEMYFGGINGFNIFHPDQIKDDSYVPPVVLTSFKKLNKEVLVGADLATISSVRVSAGERVFSFEFAALSYRAPQKNRYAYRLVGFQEEWSDLGTKRDVTFTNLNPGTYTLEVQGSNGDGIWNEQGLALEVIVEPPYWRTWWFKSLAVFGVSAVLWGSYMARTRSMRKHNLALQAEIAERRRAENERLRLIEELERNNRELETRNAEMERFTYTVSHDLKTPLVTIKGFLGLLRRDLTRGDAESTEIDIARISSAADKMDLLLKDLLELSRVGRLMNPPEHLSLTALAEEATAQLSVPIAGGGVKVEIDGEMPFVYGDRVRMSEMLDNLITNAIKFMGAQEAPTVEIGARPEGRDQVLGWVRDNGIGIAPRYHEKVFGLFERLNPTIEGTGVGLALVHQIVEVHGGRSWIESAGEGRGTTVFFTLPSGDAPSRS